MIVIAIVAVIAMLTGIIISRYLARVHSIRTLAVKCQALYTAESGIKYVFNRMKQDGDLVIDWRTGDHFNDVPLKIRLFSGHDGETTISVRDDCGYLFIRSCAGTGQTIEISSAGILPGEMAASLCLVSEKPAVLCTGSQVKGKIILNHEPLYRGGSIDGMLETRGDLSLPPIFCNGFQNSIDYFHYLLSTPEACDTELFAGQVFAPLRVFPASRIFVNDAVLIDSDSTWFAGKNITIVSTAQVQVSGNANIDGFILVAAGSVKILENATVTGTRIFSIDRIEVGDNAKFSGALIAPEIIVAGNAHLDDPSVIYCGSPLKKGKISFSSKAIQRCSVINTCVDENSLLEISPEVKMEGFIYSLAPVKHRGEFNGFLYCRGFSDMLIPGDTSNQNVIRGRIIAPADESTSLSIPVVFKGIRNFRLVEWREF